MGNCLRHEECVAPMTSLDVEKERLLWISTSNSKIRGTKIRITKKELEDMLGRLNMQGVTVDQVLSTILINSRGNGKHHRNQRQWRPVLQRIPEVY
ncbi:hypothetical protein MTR67_007771 [Solanum verrucosum]|uniref:Uncharacterized protein n=1 Tax=Solanum verrucosum TaxID=315347 RepID=A0AAF0Q0G2_SOLVR|nr:hypothetical protein MTR67_007771 [Solanum verrucosum]